MIASKGNKMLPKIRSFVEQELQGIYSKCSPRHRGTNHEQYNR